MSPYTLEVFGFKKGARVRVTKQNKYPTEKLDGELGIVHAVYGSNIAVKMDNLNNARSSGGWYYLTPKELELVNGLDYFNYVKNDIFNTVRASERYAIGKFKEEYVETMKLEDVKVIVNGKTYSATDVNWIQTPGDYPRIEVGAFMNPLTASIPPLKMAPIHSKPLSIVNVIFNDPATIVFWSDNTKTVVKCDYECESYDPEKGIAMAIAKKMLGENKSKYYNLFKPWLEKYDKQLEKEACDVIDKWEELYKTFAEWGNRNKEF